MFASNCAVCVCKNVSCYYELRLRKLTLYFIMLKNGHTLKILRCSHRMIFEVCLAIFQNNEIKD